MAISTKSFAAWKEEMSTGNPFANVVAQDIMEPFPAVLQRDGRTERTGRGAPPLGSSRAALCRSRRTIGRRCCRRKHGRRNATSITRAVGGHDARYAGDDSPTTPTFPEIFEAFSSRGCATLVVTANDRPLGYLTFDGFLSMIDPIDAESFAQTDKPADELAISSCRRRSAKPAAKATLIGRLRLGTTGEASTARRSIALERREVISYRVVEILFRDLQRQFVVVAEVDYLLQQVTSVAAAERSRQA